MRINVVILKILFTSKMLFLLLLLLCVVMKKSSGIRVKSMICNIISFFYKKKPYPWIKAASVNNLLDASF